MAYDVKLGSGFRLDIVDINPVNIQLGQFSVNPPRLLLEVGGTST